MAWVGDNIFSYAQSYLTGFCVNCPESASTVMNDLAEVGPTFYFAPPRVYENLLTNVTIRMENAGRLKQRMFRYFMDVARRTGKALLDGEPAPLAGRLLYRLGDLLVYGPLRNTLGFSRGTSRLHRGGGYRPRHLRLLPLDRDQHQAALRPDGSVCLRHHPARRRSRSGNRGGGRSPTWS